MHNKLIHMENDLRPIVEEILERSREGEIVSGRCSEQSYEFEFVEQVYALLEETVSRTMELMRNYVPA